MPLVQPTRTSDGFSNSGAPARRRINDHSVAGRRALPSSSRTPGDHPAHFPNTAVDTVDDAAARHLDLARACDQPVIVCTDALIRFINEAAIDALGASTEDELLARRIDACIDLRSVRASEPVSRPIEHVEMDVVRIGGSVVRLTVAWMRCRFDGWDSIQILLRQPVAQRSVERRLHPPARHDLLTGLPTRVELRDRLVGAIARAQRSGRSVAIISVNVDRMRDVNAQYGRDIGDEVLHAVADRLARSIRKMDSVARIDGDEFGLILEGLADRAQSTIVANRVLAAIREPIAVGGSLVRVTIGAGIAACPVDAADSDGLMRVADIALHASKAAGGNSCRFYSAELERMTPRDKARREQTIERIDTLTADEREVLDVLIEGNPNEVISRLLGASARTVEGHRSRILQKMRAQSLPDLIRMVVEARGGR